MPERVRQALHVRTEVTEGDPAAGILQAGRRLKVSLIVMGTQGLGGFRKLLLGSTTEHVLRRTEWPVLAVPAGAVSARAVEHPGVQLRRILLAKDFREGATAAMQWASDLASDMKVPVVLAHVVEPVVVPPGWQALAADFESDRAGLVVMGLANPEDSEPRNPGSIAYRVLRIGHVAVVVVPAGRGEPRQKPVTAQMRHRIGVD